MKLMAEGSCKKSANEANNIIIVQSAQVIFIICN